MGRQIETRWVPSGEAGACAACGTRIASAMSRTVVRVSKRPPELACSAGCAQKVLDRLLSRDTRKYR